jgi:hypothetical protein
VPLKFFTAIGGACTAVFDRIAALRDRMPFGSLTLSRALAVASVLFMAGIVVADLIGPTPANSSVAPVSVRRPEWIASTRTYGAFALEAAALEGLEQSYIVRRHRENGSRQDLMTWGTADSDGAFVKVAIYRAGPEATIAGDPLDAAAAVAAESGIEAQLTGPVDELKTKFGQLPIIDMTVWSATGPRACLAVAASWSQPRLGLVAWWCNKRWDLVQRGQVACLIDRLVLISAGGDEKVAEFFARAERSRDFCGVSPLLGSTPKRPDDWIFAKAEPKLRGRLSGR